MAKVVDIKPKQEQKIIKKQLKKLNDAAPTFLDKLSLLKSDGKYDVKSLQAAWDNLYYMSQNGELDKLIIQPERPLK